MNMRIGIITGVAQEADAFCRGRGDVEAAQPGFSPRRLMIAGHDVWIGCSGIGKVNAAMAATMLVMRQQVDLLMIIGTAGRLSTIMGDCFVIESAVQGDYGAQRAQGFAHYSAGSWPIGPAAVEAFRAIDLPGCALPRARIVTGDAFVECPDHSLRLRDALGGDLVDMETAALAQVATRFGLRWAAIKAVSDDANGDSAGDFEVNLARAAQRAASAAEAAIAAL